MNIIAYLRVSTDKQGESGLGLEAQRRQIEAYTEIYGMTIIDTIVDLASAKSMKREGLQRALSMLKEGKAEGIIVSKLDRLTRSVKDLGLLIEKYFSKYALISVNDKIDTSSASGRFVLNILASVSQWERETIGERTSQALQVKRSSGFKLGQAPYGYTMIEGSLVMNMEEQRVLSIIDDLREQGITYRGIAEELNRQGFQTRRGLKWTTHNLFNVAREVA